MIVRPEEVEAFSSFLTAYEDAVAWPRAIAIGLRDRDALGNPAEVATAIIEALPPSHRGDPVFTPLVEHEALAYLRRSPHLLIPSGFDEIRVEPEPAKELAIAVHHKLEEQGLPTGIDFPWRLPSHQAFEFMLGVHARDAGSGNWYRSAALDIATYTLELRASDPSKSRRIGLREIESNCRRALRGDAHSSVLLLPNLWRSPTDFPRIAVADAAREIVLQLKSETITTASLSWQQFEYVVAELLGSKGFEIDVTPRSSDGGRDIIARGQLVPGETVVLAVEVKHKPTVKVGEVRGHLYANREFPILLVATSGRFSAGVKREKNRPENFLRLQLRDGLAISDWIHDY